MKYGTSTLRPTSGNSAIRIAVGPTIEHLNIQLVGFEINGHGSAYSAHICALEGVINALIDECEYLKGHRVKHTATF